MQSERTGGKAVERIRRLFDEANESPDEQEEERRAKVLPKRLFAGGRRSEES
jgi:hypothetical protein